MDQKTFPLNDVDTLPLNRMILLQLDSIKVKCSATAVDDATRFCKVHFRMLCDTCVCAQGTDCEFLAIEDASDIKHILVNEIAKCPEERLSPQQRQRLILPMSLGLSELMTLLAAVNEAMEPLICSGCADGNIRLVDRINVELYCGGCGEKLKVKDPELAASLLPYIESSNEMRNALRISLQQRLRSVDFHSLSLEQTQWLRNNSMPFRTFYRIAKELADLSMSEQASGKPLPDTFHCPRCSNSMNNQEYALRQLPCRSALHAICNCCAETLAKETSLQCPIDGNCFYSPALGLPEIRKDYPTVQVDTEPNPDPSSVSNFMNADPLPRPSSPVNPPEPNIPGIVGSGMYLVNKGTLIPKFVAASWLPESIPKDKFVCANRYFRVLPSLTEKLEPSSPEECSFLAAWLIDRYINQVEALTLLCCANVKLWGLGIANPIDSHKKAIVDWVKLYQGEEAKGDFKEVRLANNELLGSEGVITDIYFTGPIVLTAFTQVTLKIKLVPLPGCDKSTFLFHGNHVGRREDLVGTDEISWETSPTLAVEEKESNSGQQHFIGPILRLIYESPNE